MKSYDYEAVTYDHEVFCLDCLEEKGVSFEDSEVLPIFADSEWTFYPICSVCGREHDYVSLISYPFYEDTLNTYEKENESSIDFRRFNQDSVTDLIIDVEPVY